MRPAPPAPPAARSFPLLYTPALLPFVAVGCATQAAFRRSIPPGPSWAQPVAAAAATDPSMHRQFTASVIEPVRRHLADILEGAVARGEARPDADLGFIHDVLIGTLLHHLVICQQPVDEAFTSHFTELVRFVYNDAR